MRAHLYKSIFVLSAFFFYISMSSAPSTLAYSEKEPLILRCGIDNPPHDIGGMTMKRMGDVVEQKTNGRIKFQMFYNGTLLSKTAYVEGVGKGVADMSTGPVSFITGKIPAFSIIEIYGSYKLDKWLEVLKAVDPTFQKILEPKGVRSYIFISSGPAIFAHRSTFLKSPDNWKGQKMRLGGRWQSTLGKTWGAAPVFLPPSDLYVALQRGTIDGYMLVWGIAHGLKLYEVAPYMTDTGFSLNLEMQTLSLKTWNSLTAPDRKLFNEAAQEVASWNYEENLKYQDRVRKDILSKGGKVYELTPAEKRLYLKDAFALWPEVQKISGPAGSELMDIMKRFRDE